MVFGTKLELIMAQSSTSLYIHRRNCQPTGPFQGEPLLSKQHPSRYAVWLVNMQYNDNNNNNNNNNNNYNNNIKNNRGNPTPHSCFQ